MYVTVQGGVLPQITQISAVEVVSEQQFNTYVNPTVPIDKTATSVTGIAYFEGQMTVNGTKVQSVNIRSAVDDMIAWISKFQNVCLVAHNGRRFDFPILVTTLTNLGVFDKFSKCAFIDSLSVFRKLYPKQSLKQVDLVSSILGEVYDAHNAIEDVKALGKLIQHVNLPTKDLMEHSFSPSAVANNIMFNKAKASNLPSLNPLIYTGVMKRPTAENIAGSGLNLSHLKLLYSRGGEDALRDVFTAKNSEGLPRVTNVKKLLDEIIPKMSKFFE
jgi:DNA polymerase III alpha subunit (gram-positive type)